MSTRQGNPLRGISNFNAMPRPATVLVTGDRAETQEDVFRRDVVPERLRRAAVTTTSEPAMA